MTVAVLQGDGIGGKEIGLEDVLRLVESKKQLSTADSDDTDTVEAFVALGGKVSTMLTANTAAAFRTCTQGVLQMACRLIDQAKYWLKS